MRPASWSGPWAASLVQLMWIELVNQGRLAAALADPSSPEAITYDTDRLTDRSLELLGAKCRDGRADAEDPHGRRGHQPAGGAPRPAAASGWSRQPTTRVGCDQPVPWSHRQRRARRMTATALVPPTCTDRADTPGQD